MHRTTGRSWASAGAAPTSPKLVEPCAASTAFQLALRTITVEPRWVSVPFHRLLIRWPLGSVQVTTHPAMFSLPRLVTVTATWYPVDHVSVRVYLASHSADSATTSVVVTGDD